MPRTPTQPFVLETPDQIEAIASPTRHAVLEAFSMRGPCPIAEAAELIDRPPTSLYAHVKRLEEAGLLQLVEQRKQGRHVVAIYDVPGRPIHVKLDNTNPRIIQSIDKLINAHAKLAARETANAYAARDSVRHGPARDVNALHMTSWLDDQQVARINEILDEACEIFSEAVERRPDTRRVGLNILLWPSSESGSPIADDAED